MPDNRSRWAALVVLCTGMLMIVLDMTVVNVALPSIQHDLGFSQSSLAWVVNAYLIAYGGLMLLAGRLRGPVRRRGGLAALRRLGQPANAGRRALRAGGRWRSQFGRGSWNDRHAVPGAGGAGTS